MSYLKSITEVALRYERLLWSGCLVIYYTYILLCVLNLPREGREKKVDRSYSPFPSHTDHIVLLTNQIMRFVMSFEVGTL